MHFVVYDTTTRILSIGYTNNIKHSYFFFRQDEDPADIGRLCYGDCVLRLSLVRCSIIAAFLQ